LRFVTWNVRILSKPGSLTTVGRELTVYKLDLVCAQEVRLDTGGNLALGDFDRIYGKENHQFGTVYLPLRIISAVKTVGFVSDFFHVGL
jgi:hypothetical protein